MVDFIQDDNPQLMPSFLDYWRQNVQNDATPLSIYGDYLLKMVQYYPDVMPYYEKELLSFALKNPLATHFQGHSCMKYLKFLVELTIKTNQVSDYQNYFELLNQYQFGGHTFSEKLEKEYKIISGLLNKLLVIDNNHLSAEKRWLENRLIFNIKQSIEFLQKMWNEENNDYSIEYELLKLGLSVFEKCLKLDEKYDLTGLYDLIITKMYQLLNTNSHPKFFDLFANLLEKLISTNFERAYENEVLEICTVFFGWDSTSGLILYDFVRSLLEKQNYDFVFKLNQKISSSIKREYIRLAISLEPGLECDTFNEIMNAHDYKILEYKNQLIQALSTDVYKVLDILNEIYFHFDKSIESNIMTVLVTRISEAFFSDSKKKENLLNFLELHCRYSSAPFLDELYFLVVSDPKIFFNIRIRNRTELAEPKILPDLYNPNEGKKLLLGLYVAMVNAKRPIPPSYYDFVKHYEQVNAKNKSRHQIHLNTFMVNNLGLIICFYELMGDDVFLFMKKMVKTSVLGLSRYFKNLHDIPNEYFPILRTWVHYFKQEQIKNTPSSYDQILCLISLLEQLRKSLDPENEKLLFQTNYYESLLTIVEENKKEPLALLNFINQKSAAVYKAVLALPDTVKININSIIERPEVFLRLVIGRETLNDEGMKLMFDRCIEHDFKMDFKEFVNSLEQKDELGLRLAQFNQSIKNQLISAKINTDLALNYQRKHSFNCITNDGVDWENLARAIFADLNILSELCLQEGEQVKLAQLMKKAIHQVNKGQSVNLKPIYNGALDIILAKVKNQLQVLLTQQISPKLSEHGKHFLDHYDDLNHQKALYQRAKKPQSIVKSFSVSNWDKNQMTTFLLGDYLSCCLAPDGGRFHAIVQRRIDAAMMMHVVYDDALQEPVCGNWLFLAKDKKNPELIYVVANFIEIRAGYAYNERLRKHLVQELLDYTGKYAEEIGAAAFIICRLTHGLIPDLKEDYDLESGIEIEKIGGFFSPFEEEANEYSYYLDAIGLNQFYYYKPKKITYSGGFFALKKEENSDSDTKSQRKSL